MPRPTVANQFDQHHPQFTAVGVAALAVSNRSALLTQMRPDAPVTFIPAVHVSAMWQAMSIQTTKPLAF